MSKFDENQIQRRLKALSQIEPGSEATGRAIQKARDALKDKDRTRQRAGTGIWRIVFKSPIAKFAAAAVLILSIGYAAGRLSAPPVDTEELRAALRQDLLEEMNERWQSAFAANCAQLKDELQRQVRRDLTEFAAQTLAASGTLTNQRLMELIQLIEATRRRERQQIEEAFEQLEQEKILLRNGLLAVAAQTNELLGTKQD